MIVPENGPPQLPIGEIEGSGVVFRDNQFYAVDDSMRAVSLVNAVDVTVRLNLRNQTQERRHEGVNARGQQQERNYQALIVDIVNEIENLGPQDALDEEGNALRQNFVDLAVAIDERSQALRYYIRPAVNNLGLDYALKNRLISSFTPTKLQIQGEHLSISPYALLRCQQWF